MAARVNPRPCAHQSSAFNERGVIESPAFVLSRPDPGDGFQITARAHAVGGEWIAEAAWQCASGHLPGDGSYPHTGSQPLKSRSEAVEDALGRVLRQITGQLGSAANEPKWARWIEAARAWVAVAVRQVREHDETLPLRGLTVADLFAGGLGGFGVALTSLGARVVLACEIDTEARSVYVPNVKPERVCGDICALDARGVRVDIATFGLLCQAFSRSGKRLGFRDPNLAPAYAAFLRVLGEIDAKVIIVECAPDFLTHEGGRDAETVRDALRRAGFRVQHRALNAAGFGVAQARERSFIVATRLGLPLDDVLGHLFPAEAPPSAAVEDILDQHVPATIPDSEIVFDAPEPGSRVPRRARVGRIDGKKCQGYRVYSPKGLGATLTASTGGKAQHSEAIRVRGGARPLTPREAARMQGLPEWAVVHANRRQAMRHAGNAVAVPVARELARGLAMVFKDAGGAR